MAQVSHLDAIPNAADTVLRAARYSGLSDELTAAVILLAHLPYQSVADRLDEAAERAKQV